LLDIYAASEDPIPGVTAEALMQRIRSAGTKADYAGSFADAASRAASLAESGDLILTLGAGSVYQIGPMVLEQLVACWDREKSGDRGIGRSDEMRSPDHPISR